MLSEGFHILAGSPKVGKSWLALWLSVVVAKGEDTFLFIPSLEKQDIYKFILEGINIEVCDSEEYEFRLR